MSFFIKAFILSILFFKYNTNIIVLPFKTNITQSGLEHFYSKELYTEVSVGEPPETLYMNINADTYLYYLLSGYCNNNFPSFYNYSNSQTFRRVKHGYEDDYCDELGDGIFASETFAFYNSTDLQTNITQKDLDFFYSYFRAYETHKDVCGIIGFGLREKFIDYTLEPFLMSLKRKGLINDYSWTYLYFEKAHNKILNVPGITNKYIIDNYDGLIILGNYTHNILDNDKNQNIYISIPAAERNKYLKWALTFHKIFCKYKEEILINKNIQADLAINYDYIIAPKEYFEKLIFPFFEFYLEKEICKINELKDNTLKFEVISCSKKLFTIKHIKKFPTIYFFHYDFNHTFAMKNEELFKEINNNIYFLILKNVGEFNQDIWKLGKIFLKKYNFSFNLDSKIIKLYMPYEQNRKDNDKENSKNKIKSNLNIIMWIGICIVCLIFGIFVGNKIIQRNRKKRANELQDDEYDYKTENSINDKGKNILGEKKTDDGTKDLEFE